MSGLTTERVEVRHAEWIEWEHELRAIRSEVFIEEQGVPRELEWDGLDKTAYHFIARTIAAPHRSIGTARLLRSGQIGRMAVLLPYRHRGIGMELLRVAVEYAREKKIKKIHLHAQTHARQFYEKAGFRVVGDEFLEAGIPHLEMELFSC